MCKKKRIISYIRTAIGEMELVEQMSEPIVEADDFTIPWSQVFGMRNFIVHEYANVDEEAIFTTIKQDFRH